MKRIGPVLIASLLLIVSTIGPAVSSSNSTTSGTEDKPPTAFKVFNQDGRESLTASCSPKDLKNGFDSATEVTCRFTHVRFDLPEEIPGLDAFASGSQEEHAKLFPQFAEEIRRKDPKKFRKEFDQVMRAEMCSPEGRSKMEAELRNPSAGPKRKANIEQFLRACASKSSSAEIATLMSAMVKSVCRLYVDHFSLDFRKTGPGHWLYTKEQPGRLKVYELMGAGLLWTLTETPLPMSRPESEQEQQSIQRTVWTWNSYAEFEVPAECDFISHDRVQVP